MPRPSRTQFEQEEDGRFSENQKVFPPMEHRQSAIMKSFFIIRCMVKAWSQHAEMARNNWSLLNACAASAIYNCTHGRRKMEWEEAPLHNVRAVLEEETSFLVCTKFRIVHNTMVDRFKIPLDASLSQIMGNMMVSLFLVFAYRW